MFNKLNNNTEEFNFDDEELNLIENKKKDYNKLLKEYIDSILYLYDEFNNKFGILYANYEYRNEIAEYIRNMGNPVDIKYVIIVAMDKGFGQKSYRTITDGFDVNEIAELHGGGGHPNAASVNITKEQRDEAKTLDEKESLKYLAKCQYFI